MLSSLHIWAPFFLNVFQPFLQRLEDHSRIGRCLVDEVEAFYTVARCVTHVAARFLGAGKVGHID
jgi:hypothetical protein